DRLPWCKDLRSFKIPDLFCAVRIMDRPEQSGLRQWSAWLLAEEHDPVARRDELVLLPLQDPVLGKTTVERGRIHRVLDPGDGAVALESPLRRVSHPSVGRRSPQG